MTFPSVPEKNKKPGILYATTREGVELPVIDCTHPAFALSWTAAEQAALVESFLGERPPFTRLPAALRRLLYGFFLRGSFLAGGIRRAEGTFLSGMDTYAMKLGPGNLPSALATPLDRKIAAALPAAAVRVRLADMARLLADAVGPQLAAPPDRPLAFVNIAGGPAMDSLNALILLRREHPAAIEHRPITIDVLDRDEAGAYFGERALAALTAEGAPLSGLRIAFRRIAYDWSKPAELEPVLDALRQRAALVVGSSEGGLFEYGSDEEIVKNLDALRRALGDGFVMVGSVTRADAPIRRLHGLSSASTRLRGLEVFRALIEKHGWTVGRAVERPFSDHVVLRSAS